jgi:hypothetical protein
MMNLFDISERRSKGKEYLAYIHLQARSPRARSRPLVMPAVISPENAPEIKEPEYINAVLSPSSLRVYHEERKNSTPGWEILAS